MQDDSYGAYNMNSRNLGRLGENLFEQLCIEADLTVNCSQADEHGWDFIVEYPRTLTFNKNLEKIDQSNRQFKVQVKATRKQKTSWQIELSNLHSMCTDSLPTFYFFIHYDSNNQVKAGYLLHVDQGIINKTLEKVYLNEFEKKRKQTKSNILFHTRKTS